MKASVGLTTYVTICIQILIFEWTFSLSSWPNELKIFFLCQWKNYKLQKVSTFHRMTDIDHLDSWERTFVESLYFLGWQKVCQKPQSSMFPDWPATYHWSSCNVCIHYPLVGKFSAFQYENKCVRARAPCDTIGIMNCIVANDIVDRS